MTKTQADRIAEGFLCSVFAGLGASMAPRNPWIVAVECFAGIMSYEIMRALTLTWWTRRKARRA